MTYYRDGCEPDPFDDIDDERPTYVECKRCGKGGLVWEETDDGFVLVNEHTREVHHCAAKDQTRGAFGPVT